MKRHLNLAIAAIASLHPAPLLAQNWMYEGTDSAFDGGSGTHLAMGANGQYAIGVRCDKDAPVYVFLTPELFSNEDLSNLGFAMAQLLIRADDKSVIEKFATIDSADGKLRATANAEKSEIEQLRDAKSRIAVAMKVGDQIIHETQIPARGSTSAVTKFLGKCKSLGGN